MQITDKTRVELRAVKYAAFASEETSCFSATVYINGEKAGTVDNDGHGGSNRYSTSALHYTLNAIAATLPDYVYTVGDRTESMKQDADMLVGDLLEAFLEHRDLKRHCSKKTLFRLKGETYQKGEWLTVKAPFSVQVKEYLQKKYGDRLVEILNETLS